MAKLRAFSSGHWLDSNLLTGLVNLDLPIDVSETETRELLGGKKDTLPKEGPLICPPGKINCIKKKATEKIELVARPKTESSVDGGIGVMDLRMVLVWWFRVKACCPHQSEEELWEGNFGTLRTSLFGRRTSRLNWRHLALVTDSFLIYCLAWQILIYLWHIWD